MKKLLTRIIPGLAWLSLAAAQVPPPPAGMPTPAAPQLGADSYILMDFDSGTVLVEHQPDLRVDIASITKLMTSYVVFQELAAGKVSLDDAVPVSEKAWRTEGSRMFIEPDMQVSVEELLMGLIVQSGNDASVALAEFLAGTEEAFAGVMNYYAGQLGMAHTHFVNATGLPDPEHYSTARDTALLSAAIIRDFPNYYTWYSEKEYTFNNIRQHNRNNLLWRDPAVDGLKTGHTEAAGYCLASSAKREGMRLVGVVMGSSSEQARASESQSLLNYGFRFFETLQLYKAGEQLAEGRVWKGVSEQVRLGLPDDLFITIPRGRYDDLEARVEMQPELVAPLELGAEVGRIVIQLDDEPVASRALVTLEGVAPAGFFGRAWDGIRLWAGSFFDDE
ncbi:MAG: serine hydrolase [Xanthomonadales bacterium]|nr:serine hydrolase [Xanthomonadales bacterium]NIN60294.1 serine hydrolase [Xanthomonadales bacterium]NIN75646.1 serine hydrolase [Xanthomonadales bacterium]NIO14719.1 serine hydrolase [Xanthomonadales bacterium]NIP12687.1 serine hydrolase [Xanthomonadales bacterium]